MIIFGLGFFVLFLGGLLSHATGFDPPFIPWALACVSCIMAFGLTMDNRRMGGVLAVCYGPIWAGYVVAFGEYVGLYSLDPVRNLFGAA